MQKTVNGTDPTVKLRTLWTQRGILETELAVDRKGTIVQGAPSCVPAVSWSALVSELPEATAQSGPVVVLGAEIGRGGMGVVRSALFVNAINRNAIALLSVGWALGDLYWVGAWAVNMPFDSAVVGVAPVTVFVIAGHAASVDRRLVPHALVAFAGNALMFPFPGWGLELMGLTGGIVLIMLGWTWKRAPAAPHVSRTS